MESVGRVPPSASRPSDARQRLLAAGSGYGTPSYPVTPGAAQIQPGGGLFSTLVVLGPCSNAYVAKSDANGNLVFGAFLGGQTDDSANALAVNTAGNVDIVGKTGGLLPTGPRLYRQTECGRLRHPL